MPNRASRTEVQMYSRKLLLSSILIRLNGSGSSQVMLDSAGFSTLNEPADAAASSAISSELRGMAAKGQLGNNLNTAGYREQIKRLYESSNFAPLWITGDEPTSQATYSIETLRASRLKGLNPSDYDAESLGTQSKSLKERQLPLRLRRCISHHVDDAVHLGSANRANQSQTSEVRHRRSVQTIQSAGIYCATGRKCRKR